MQILIFFPLLNFTQKTLIVLKVFDTFAARKIKHGITGKNY